MKKKASRNGIYVRRFHVQLSKLREKCESMGITLYSNKSNYMAANFVCILSFNDYEIGEPLSKCDDSYESYYLAPSDYEKITMSED